MQVVEYGKEHSSVVVLLHGGGLSWWNYKEVAALLQPKYHVVIPLLDGHAGSDRNFTSIEQNAEEICQYIQKEFGNSVFAMGGLSLGGQILLEMLSREPNICQKAIIESALIKPMKITHQLTAPMVNASYGLMKKQWFSKLQFAQLRIKPELYEAYYADTCQITKDNMISFLKSNSAFRPKASLAEVSAKVIIAVGDKEPRIMRQSAKELHERMPRSELRVFPGYYHGELSLAHAQEYVALIEGE